MTERPRSPSEFDVRWLPISELPSDVTELVNVFQNPSVPLSAMPEPKLFNDQEVALQSLKSLIDLTKPPNLENQEKNKKVAKASEGLFAFAKKHPFLTAGMAVALILLLLSFQTLSSTLAHHTSLNIFHAHLVVGGGIAFMFLYYAVMLNNMRKRAQIEDAQQEKINAADDLIAQMTARKDLTRKEFVQELNREIKTMHAQEIALIKEYEKQQEILRGQLLQIEKSRDNLYEVNTVLNGLLKELMAKKEDPTLRTGYQQQFDQIGEALKEGAQALECPTISEIPLMPQIELLSTEVSLPTDQTKAMLENASKAKRIANGLSNLTRSIGSAIKSNPGSKVYYTVGLFILALAGVGLYLWLRGYSDVYFFGMLSLSTLVPMAIYGICMIYEGWNNSSINALYATLDTIEKEKEKKVLELESHMERLSSISKEAQKVFNQFKESWLVKRKTQATMQTKLLALTADLQKTEDKLTADFLHYLLDVFPSIKSEEISTEIRYKFVSTFEYVQRKTTS